MNQEIEEYLNIVEMKLFSLIQDIKNIRSKLKDPSAQERQERQERNSTFFDALRSEDTAPGARK